MIALGEETRVYLALGATDMRKSIDSLAALVVDVLQQDPCTAQVFVFCNRGRDKLKVLCWQRNGFWLCYRRLERERFRWPSVSADASAVTVTTRELRWLLDGLQWQRMEGHREVHFRVL
ncbi:IS66 family insertion sequence element accessory protein TnpB [uncultured Thiodictyon sp.]|uniref:IS66 family insertion sequence element accessory protein TnpB n=1 Tax=uncultured Thiodictyon sp. TaxID=1846217 RepID=UPI0025CE81EE|nr:IS66 family insertion sequence element accessory protein TnpB [uncultured Thiodictyon sp.]